MGDRKPWGQLIPTRDGRYLQLYEDGSITVYDQMFNVVSDDPSPNPQRAALIRAGRERDAANDAIYSRASEEDARRFDEGQQREKQRINNEYQIDLRNAKTAEQKMQADRKYQEGQLQLARDQLAFDREVQGQEFGLKQAKLGYDLIGTAAQLKGPANYFAASNLARNTAAQPGTSTFLSALQNNTRLAGFGAQAGAPQGETLGTITAKLTGQGDVGYGAGAGQGGAAAGTAGAITTGGATAADNAYLNQIHGIARRGAHTLNAGALERLTPDEFALFAGGLEAADEQGNAYSANTFLDQYRRSRIGQGLGLNRAA